MAVDGPWSDDPIEDGDHDTLDRRPYARDAARLIVEAHSFESSVVFGLSGPWGSGKSSIVSMIVEELMRTNEDWQIAKFTPWATSDVTGLLSEFYSSLVAPLPKSKKRELKKALSLLARVAAPAAAVIPYGGGSAANALNEAASQLVKAIPWREAFDEASQTLKKLKTPILMVVDDIDRLQHEELMTLLKVIRLLGRFPGVQYLLAYDDETLFHALANTSTFRQDDKAERFMEKIVQYPLLVPPLLEHQQLARLNAGLETVGRHDDPSGRLGAMRNCFVGLLRTPRAIDRYIAQLRHHLPMIQPDEIDDIDVHLLTLVRVSFPAMFNALPRYKQELISGSTGELKQDARNMEWEEFDPKPLLALVPELHRPIAEQLLFSLFPNLSIQGRSARHASTTGRGVGQENYFDRYFAMSIPANDISDALVHAAAESAQGGDARELSDLFADTTRELQILILVKLSHSSNEPRGDAQRLRFVASLSRIANELEDDKQAIFGAQDRALGLIAQCLARLTASVTADEVLEAIKPLSRNWLRIRVRKLAEHDLERIRPADLPTWPAGVTTRLVADGIGQIVAHLRDGDEASVDEAIPYQMMFVIENDHSTELRNKIESLLSAGEISLDTVASRLVSTRTIVGVTPDWQISTEINQSLFDQLVPAIDDPWYHKERVHVDLKDLSWANKRKFATGRFRAPQQEVEGAAVDGGPSASDDEASS